jgi:hypothetical protein
MQRPIILAGSSFLLAGSLLLAGAGGVNAASACRTDPLVTLSNGAQIALYEDIYDSASDTTGLSYQLYIPVGLTVTSVTYQGAVPSSLQKIAVTANENPGNYDAYAVVSTQTGNISVTAYMTGTSNGSTTVSCHTTGHSGQQLHSHLHVT